MIQSARLLCLSLIFTAQVTHHAFAQNRPADTALMAADALRGTVTTTQSRVRFTGANALKDEELRAAIPEQIREIDERGPSPARADDAAFFVGSFYRKAGYSKVETSYTISGQNVTVHIVEGPRTLLRGLTFVGNKTYGADQLFQYMIGATAERLAKEPDLFPYNQSELNAGADRVRGFYVSEGYLDATVDASQVTISADSRSATATVKITENSRYTFGDVRFVGTTGFSRDALILALGEPVDGPFSRTKAITMQRNLESFYKSKGYFLANVEVAADPKVVSKGGRVPVIFTVTPGAIHQFDGVTTKNETPGGGRLRQSFLPRRFQHLTGKMYDPEKVDATYRELLQSGLFTTLRLNPTALPDRTVRLDLTFEEAKAREVGFTLGFGTYDGFKIGIRLADRNLFGNGRPLTFAADYSQRGLDAELLYVDPWFLDSPKLNFRAKLFSADRTEKGYTKNEVGGRLELAWKALPHMEVAAFTQLSEVEITEYEIDPIFLGPISYQQHSVGISQTTNFTDNVIAPTRGWVFTTSFEGVTIDAEQSFTRAVMRFSWYQPIGKCQFAFGARAGLIEPVVEAIPIDSRFFLGGATTVRSFAERELGPKDDEGHPLGGEFYTVFNAEFTFPITGGLKGAAFVDGGHLAGRGVRGFNDTRFAVGLGLRYALPVGPLRLDYGINPDRREGEAFGAFHFSFGVAF